MKSAPGHAFYLALALVVLALTPVWLASHGQQAATLAIFGFYRKLCHQRADRSFRAFGHPAAVCVRCLGIYAGVALGSLRGCTHRHAVRCLGLALLVNGADVAAERLGMHGNLPWLRLLIGAALGFAAGAMLSANGRYDQNVRTTPRATT